MYLYYLLAKMLSTSEDAGFRSFSRECFIFVIFFKIVVYLICYANIVSFYTFWADFLNFFNKSFIQPKQILDCWIYRWSSFHFCWTVVRIFNIHLFYQRILLIFHEHKIAAEVYVVSKRVNFIYLFSRCAHLTDVLAPEHSFGVF